MLSGLESETRSRQLIVRKALPVRRPGVEGRVEGLGFRVRVKGLGFRV